MGDRGKGRKETPWVELYGGPGDGIKRRKTNLPVTLKFPDDFAVNDDFAALPPTLYKRWERVNTLIEDQLGKPRIVAAMLYYAEGTELPDHRRLTYDKYKRKA